LQAVSSGCGGRQSAGVLTELEMAPEPPGGPAGIGRFQQTELGALRLSSARIALKSSFLLFS